MQWIDELPYTSIIFYISEILFTFQKQSGLYRSPRTEIMNSYLRVGQLSHSSSVREPQGRLVVTLSEQILHQHPV